MYTVKSLFDLRRKFIISQTLKATVFCRQLAAVLDMSIVRKQLSRKYSASFKQLVMTRLRWYSTLA